MAKPLDGLGLLGSDTLGYQNLGLTNENLTPIPDARLGWEPEPGDVLHRNYGAFTK